MEGKPEEKSADRMGVAEVRTNEDLVSHSSVRIACSDSPKFRRKVLRSVIVQHPKLNASRGFKRCAMPHRFAKFYVSSS